MNPAALLASLRDAGLSLTRSGSVLRARPARALTEELRRLLRERKEELLPLLPAEGLASPVPPAPVETRSSSIDYGRRPMGRIIDTLRRAGARVELVDGAPVVRNGDALDPGLLAEARRREWRHLTVDWDR